MRHSRTEHPAKKFSRRLQRGIIFLAFGLRFVVVVRLDTPFSRPAHPRLHVPRLQLVFRFACAVPPTLNFVTGVPTFVFTFVPTFVLTFVLGPVSFVSVLILVFAHGFLHFLVPCESTPHVGFFLAPFLFIYSQMTEVRVVFASRLCQSF